MKYIKLFEAFSKDYMKKIELKDFKKIKKGTKLMYMGGKVEVLDNNGYVLKLKGDDDRIFTQPVGQQLGGCIGLHGPIVVLTVNTVNSGCERS